MRWRSWQVGVSSTADSAASTGEVAGMRAQRHHLPCARTCPCLSVTRAHPATWSCSFGLRSCSPGVGCLCLPSFVCTHAHPTTWLCSFGLHLCSLGLFVLGACPHCLVALAWLLLVLVCAHLGSFVLVRLPFVLVQPLACACINIWLVHTWWTDSPLYHKLFICIRTID